MRKKQYSHVIWDWNGTLLNTNISQSILSASAQNNLEMQLKPFKIQEYFDETLGISDIYAKSKVEIGLDYLSRNHVKEGILIGDTTHDFEVSQAMNIDCVLVAHGHQSKEKLSQCNVPVFGNLDEVLSLNHLGIRLCKMVENFVILDISIFMCFHATMKMDLVGHLERIILRHAMRMWQRR